MNNKPFAFMTIRKIKNSGQLTSIGKHNTREEDKDNIIKELSELNKEYVSLGDSWDVPEGCTFNDALEARIETLPYYKNRKIRADGVKAYEIVMSYTKDSSIDPYAWGEKSIEWLRENFDRAPDGKSNILHAVLHMDEPGNPHIHAVVLPIDEKGHFNARSFTGGSRVMSELQDTYADSVKEFGLRRGVMNSTAKHKDIAKLYAEINSVKANYPKPKENQSAIEYYREIQDYTESVMLAGHKEISETKTRMIQQMDEERNDMRIAIKEDMEAELALSSHKLKKIKKEFDETAEAKVSLDDMIAELRKELDAVNVVFRNNTIQKEELEEYEKYKKGIVSLQKNDPEYAEYIQGEMEYVKKYGKEHSIDEQEMQRLFDR